jgi:DNA-binding CsgD family transcriptional regulator
MSTELVATGVGSPPPAIFVFNRPQRRPAARYERKLTEYRLQQALAREAALLRERDGLIRNLLAWHDAAIDRIGGLTPRQRQIVELVLAGQRSKNIAAGLGISQRTVENHRALIMKKAGAKCLPALARLALAAAWPDAPDPGPRLEFSQSRRMPRSREIAQVDVIGAEARVGPLGAGGMNHPLGG